MRSASPLRILALATLLLAIVPAGARAQQILYAPAPEVEDGPLDHVTVTPTPQPQHAQPASRGECRRIARQLAHLDDVRSMAADRGDELWQASVDQQMSRMKQRWNTRCDDSQERWARAFAAALKAAGKIALRYFLFGMI
jgi:hypothetical protein